MLSRWFEAGYMGFEGNEKQRFFQWRDDDPDSDPDAEAHFANDNGTYLGNIDDITEEEEEEEEEGGEGEDCLDIAEAMFGGHVMDREGSLSDDESPDVRTRGRHRLGAGATRQHKRKRNGRRVMLSKHRVPRVHAEHGVTADPPCRSVPVNVTMLQNVPPLRGHTATLLHDMCTDRDGDGGSSLVALVFGGIDVAQRCLARHAVAVRVSHNAEGLAGRGVTSRLQCRPWRGARSYNFSEASDSSRAQALPRHRISAATAAATATAAAAVAPPPRFGHAAAGVPLRSSGWRDAAPEASSNAEVFAPSQQQQQQQQQQQRHEHLSTPLEDDDAFAVVAVATATRQQSYGGRALEDRGSSLVATTLDPHAGEELAAAGDVVAVFGGCCPSPAQLTPGIAAVRGRARDDAWLGRVVGDCVEWQQMQMFNAPSPRFHASAVWCPLLRRVLLFGGTSDGLRQADEGRLYSVRVDCDEASAEFHEVEVVGVRPEARWGHAAVMVSGGRGCDASEQMMVVSGGLAEGQRYLDSTHLLHCGTRVWRELYAPCRIPVAPRAFHSAFAFSASSHSGAPLDCFAVIGGELSGQSVPHSWQCHVPSRTWRLLATPTLSLPEAQLAVAARADLVFSSAEHRCVRSASPLSSAASAMATPDSNSVAETMPFLASPVDPLSPVGNFPGPTAPRQLHVAQSHGSMCACVCIPFHQLSRTNRLGQTHTSTALATPPQGRSCRGEADWRCVVLGGAASTAACSASQLHLTSSLKQHLALFIVQHEIVISSAGIATPGKRSATDGRAVLEDCGGTSEFERRREAVPLTHRHQCVVNTGDISWDDLFA